VTCTERLFGGCTRGLARTSLYPECCGAVERWPRVCEGTYLLLCPFFEMSFGILLKTGQLGFIVSNAFTRRELGGPLVQDFFPIVDLQKVIDCSGLMFPGMVHHCVFYLVGTKSRSRSRPSALPQSFLGRATFARNPKRVMEHAFRS